ncbi:MAG: SoxR reducing system RseC family protein [Marinobacter sp.]|nr:SoxR reducing system RseC family protein [Marinobacter sp.]
MIEETGKVIALDGTYAWVQTIRQSACASCQARHACGQRALAAVTAGRANQVRVINTLNAEVGDDVTLGIDERMLLKASLAVYAWPLLTMLAAALLGQALWPAEELRVILAAMIGLALGFVVLGLFRRRTSVGMAPSMLKKQRPSAAVGAH